MHADRTAGRQAVAEAVATLNPGYFALVMGIVSIGMRNHGLGTLSSGLLWLTVTSYVVLVALTIGRALWFPAALRADFTDPRRCQRPVPGPRWWPTESPHLA